MTFVCLWSPNWATVGAPLAELAASFMEVAPRVAVEGRGVIWADGRGLPTPRLAGSLLERAGEREARAGVSAVPVAAEAAARSGDSPVTRVEPGRERVFLAPLRLELLEPEARLRALVEGVGLRTCGELAAIERGAVEVRFGPEGLALWRLARADDPRLLFRPLLPERPQASLDFVDYSVRDGERLVFAFNALLGTVCARLEERGERARSVVLSLSLANGSVSRETLRVARPTADRGTWLRRVRSVLEGLRLPDAVVGVALEVEGTEPASARQGDLFDRGFSTAAPVEEAVTRLVEAQGPLFVAPEVCAHPLAERRTGWREREPGEAVEARPSSPAPTPPRLTAQLLREPCPVAVRTHLRRGFPTPLQYRYGKEWRRIVEAAGPDRAVGGGWEEASYQRDYFRCVTETGVLVWLFLDRREKRWYLQGWWD